MAAPECWYVGFDLASRHSGAVLLSSEKPYPLAEAVFDYGPARKPSVLMDHVPAIIDSAVTVCRWLDEAFIEGFRMVVGVEDVHVHAINSKPALRAQGALFAALYERGVEPELVSVSEWQRWHGFPHKKEVGRTTKTLAKERCEELGYSSASFKGKAAVDIRDAFLIAYYLKHRQ